MFYVSIFILLIGLFIIIHLGRLAKYKKASIVFLDKIRNIIGGNISDHNFPVAHMLIDKGRYKDREIRCYYFKPKIFGGTVALASDIILRLKSKKAPKKKWIRIVPFVKVTDNIKFSYGWLIYKKLGPKEFTKHFNPQDIISILDELVQAEELL